jgi:putative transcriptional regulator
VPRRFCCLLWGQLSSRFWDQIALRGACESKATEISRTFPPSPDGRADFRLAVPASRERCILPLTVGGPRLSPFDMPQYISNVKEHREQEGWSQEALARELGVSRQTIVNIEKGISEPRVLLAIALAATLGVAIEELFRKGTTP